MKAARRSLTTLLIVLFSLAITSAQQESPLGHQSPVPLVTATASNDRVRYASLGEVHQTRLQVFSVDGSQVFDSGLRLGNLIDWLLKDQQGSPLSTGTYLYLVTVKDFAERLTQKYGTAFLEQEQVYLQQTDRAELPQRQATALEANRLAETLTQVDRVGVAALNRTTSPLSTDGTAASDTGTSGTTSTSNPTTGGESLATGTGTSNYLARWMDNAGTLGDSSLFDTNGRVGIGTSTPNANTVLHLHKSWNNGTAFLVSNDDPGSGALVTMRAGLNPNNYAVDYASLNVLSANWTPGSAGPFLKGKTVLIEGNGSNFGIGNINNTEPLIFYTTAGRLERMRVAADGSVGIGIPNPTSKLHVLGNVNFTGFRTEDNLSSPNVIGGVSTNSVPAGVVGATIGGGGFGSSFSINRVTDNFGTVGGGFGNRAGDDAGTKSDRESATVGGGSNNIASGYIATVGGGWINTASGSLSTVGGGESNIASGATSTVGGGSLNIASGVHSTIPGGSNNRAQGLWSFAAGTYANSQHDGSFVWSDSTAWNIHTYFTSTAPNQFLINATGGVGIGTNAPSFRLHVTDTSNAGLRVETQTAGGTLASFGGFGDFQVDANGIIGGRFIVKEGGNVGIGRNNPLHKLHVNGMVAGVGPYIDASDLRYKRDIHTIGGALSKVLSLRGVTFDWRREEFPALDFASGRSVGFVAQEVEQVVPEAVTRDAAGFRSVAYSHLTPVLVEAVKEQQAQITEQRQTITELRRQNSALGALLQRQAARLDALERAASKNSRRPWRPRR